MTPKPCRLNPPRWSWATLLLALLGSACGPGACLRRSDGPSGGVRQPLREVRWPASPDVSLETELAATAAKLERKATPTSAAPPPAEPVLPPDAPGVEVRAFEFEGLWVAEVRLGEVADDEPLPLVMMLHGRGDSPRVPGGPFTRVPTPMRVLIPRGPWILGAGFSWARHSVTQGRHADLAHDLMTQAERLARLLNDVRVRRPTIGTPIVTGFSQGAMLAWVMAMRHAEAVGLALPIAGWIPPDARTASLAAVPTRAMHGDADPIVAIEPTRALVELLRNQGDEVDWLEFPGVAHEVTPEMNAQFEAWLEAALQERAPQLAGGLGEAGEDPVPVEPYEPPLDIDLSQEAVSMASEEAEPPGEEVPAGDADEAAPDEGEGTPPGAVPP